MCVVVLSFLPKLLPFVNHNNATYVELVFDSLQLGFLLQRKEPVGQSALAGLNTFDRLGKGSTSRRQHSNQGLFEFRLAHRFKANLTCSGVNERTPHIAF